MSEQRSVDFVRTSEGAWVLGQRSTRWLLALVPLAAIAACLVSIVLPGPASAIPIALGALAGLAWWIRSDRARARLLTPAEIRVASGMFTLAKPDVTFRALTTRVRSGWFVPATGRVELALDGKLRVSACMTPNDAAQLLDVVGVGVAQRRLEVPLRGTIGTPVRVLAMFTAGLAPSGIAGMAFEKFCMQSPLLYGLYEVLGDGLPILTWMALQSMIVWGTIRYLGAPRAVVGADGVRIEHLFVRRFVPYNDITNVSTSTAYVGGVGYRHVVLSRRHGKTVTLPMIAQSDADVSALVERIEAGRGLPAANDRDEALDRIARNGRSMSDWRKDLAALLAVPSNYRHQHLGREELLAVLQNPRATAERRLTAAVALSVSEGRAASERIRVAADASASEPMRVVLNKAADGDLDEASFERAVASDRAARA